MGQERNRRSPWGTPEGEDRGLLALSSSEPQGACNCLPA
jgi:hypothetical protein